MVAADCLDVVLEAEIESKSVRKLSDTVLCLEVPRPEIIFLQTNEPRKKTSLLRRNWRWKAGLGVISPAATGELVLASVWQKAVLLPTTSPTPMRKMKAEPAHV